MTAMFATTVLASSVGGNWIVAALSMVSLLAAAVLSGNAPSHRISNRVIALTLALLVAATVAAAPILSTIFFPCEGWGCWIGF